MNPLLRKMSIPASGSATINPAPASSTPQQEEFAFSMRFEDYELGNPIGYGSSAIVYIAKYLPMNKIVALKVIELDMFERNQIDELRREIQIMSLSRHPNLLPVYGSFVNGQMLYIVTPFLSAGSILDIMKTAYPHGIDEVCIATILKQALQGLEYLHKNGLIHRDVKAGNLLIDDDGLVQLADFGVSSSLMETGERKGIRKTFVGTPCWMAPEVMEQTGYDYKADIWSFGITALELATGHAPFAKYPPIKVMMLTLQNEPPTLDRERSYHKYAKSFKDLIDSCLQKDPSKRPAAEKLLQHAFFKLAAKSRQHLATELLQALPPITKRVHARKTLPRMQEDVRGVSWDFSSDSETPDPANIPSSINTQNPSGQLNLALKSSPLAEIEAAQTPPSTSEVKKGRFSVSEQPKKPNIENSEGAILDVKLQNSDTSSGSSPVTSNAGSSPRQSRFIVSSNDIIPVNASIPIAKNSSNDKRSRFEIHAVLSDTSATSSPTASMGRTTTTSRFATSIVNAGDDGVSATVEFPHLFHVFSF
ncbi:hypothetical protein HK100_010240 [Physocladia obscura]|uniref:Protein kinase domain-containing protein n=1 Tax=Physocladia obscura TaxID=109957 RepID=A0AAD5T5E8_9FUNG|nr:hypothetical protein HK100_010240 [Physocladia obscura]